MTLDQATSLILEQARELYYRWPDLGHGAGVTSGRAPFLGRP